VLAALAALAAPLAAQDSTATDSGRVIVPDSLGVLRTKPSSVLWRSLLLPGWGQAKGGHKLTAAFFFATEALTLGMSLKKNSELKHLRSINADSVAIDDKTKAREDWLVLMAVNHVLAGLEAYISAHLSDFPAELKFRRVPGGMSAQVAIPLHLP
jgi:hypothetical protein